MKDGYDIDKMIQECEQLREQNRNLQNVVADLYNDNINLLQERPFSNVNLTNTIAAPFLKALWKALKDEEDEEE